MGITHDEVMAIIGALVAIVLWLSIISHQLIKISGLLKDWRKDNGYEEKTNDNTDAKWEEMPDPVGGSIPWIVCSNCGGKATQDNFDKYKLTDYCPNCGAKMAETEAKNEDSAYTSNCF